jgi:phenylacetate-CoA ligase
MSKKFSNNILIVGPLPPPLGGVSIHIKRLSRLINDDFLVDFVDESSQMKDEYFNLRTFHILNYLKKVRDTGLIYIHSGKRQLAFFHIVVGRLFGKRVLLTIHAYPNANRDLSTRIDSFFYSKAHRIIVVNSFILDRLRLPESKCTVRCAFIPPSMTEEPELPDHLIRWIQDKRSKRKVIICANAYQLKMFNSQDLYGLDMCIDVAERLNKRGFPFIFIFVVSSLEKNRELYEQYEERIKNSKFLNNFLLLNEELSFVKLITYSDIVLRPTNTDGDALTIREALFLNTPVIASDVISRPEGTILFKNRDVDDLEKEIIRTVALSNEIKLSFPSDDESDYHKFYKGLIDSVLKGNDAGQSHISANLKDTSMLLSEKIPASAGVMLNHVPFWIRLGFDYTRYYKLADRLLKSDEKDRVEYMIKNFRRVYDHFRQNSFFYEQFLEKFGSPDNIRNLDDIQNIPILTKSSLREMPVEKRTIMQYAFKKFNTGGTSGSPLSFYLDNMYYQREWSHIHYMWGRIGYKPTSTKITIRGKNIKDIYKYRFNQNEFLINSYYSFNDEDYRNLLKIFKRYNTEFIHGYPSAIYYFLKEISIYAPYLLDFLKKNIKGVLFGSEYPSPRYRNYIEDMLTRNTLSWYGHTEGLILAGELYQKYEYVPFLSYGFVEAVKSDNHYHLVGTSFDNYASPFIRYDTEDLIEPEFNEYGMVESFRIKEGRLGEFVVDRNNKKISLTALIFGRHHKLFDKVNFIQVKQTVPGQITVYYSNFTPIENPSALFDSTNLNLEVLFEQIKEPFKTSFGKIPLLIK